MIKYIIFKTWYLEITLSQLWQNKTTQSCVCYVISIVIYRKTVFLLLFTWLVRQTEVHINCRYDLDYEHSTFIRIHTLIHTWNYHYLCKAHSALNVLAQSEDSVSEVFFLKGSSRISMGGNQLTSRALMHNASQPNSPLTNPLKPLGPHLLTSLSLLLSFVLRCLESWMVNVTPLTPQQWRTHWLYNEGAGLLGVWVLIKPLACKPLWYNCSNPIIWQITNRIACWVLS